MSGPLEVRLNLELPSQATLDIQIRPLPSVPGTDSKALATTIKSVLTPALFLSYHPRTLVQIVGQALSSNSSGNTGRVWNASLVASLLNACSAALINASSIPMKGIVCAVAVGRLSTGPGEEAMLVLDPSDEELSHCLGIGCFAFFFSSTLSPTPPLSGDIPPSSLLWTNYTSSTPFNESELTAARELASEGCREVWKKMKESLAWIESSVSAHTGFNNAESGNSYDQLETNVKDDDDEDDAKMEI